MKPIVFTLHARQRLTRRGVSQDEARRTIRTPDRVQRARSGRLKATKKIASSSVHVIYGEGDAAIVVVTGYRDK
ncbi:MAG: DUF4258 domain-containing protein [Candidatus Omnitrophica bacterium]|nr:DUF4258 domain-containing protein [Candidatus Omnitrophota bacterium]